MTSAAAYSGQHSGFLPLTTLNSKQNEKVAFTKNTQTRSTLTDGLQAGAKGGSRRLDPAGRAPKTSSEPPSPVWWEDTGSVSSATLKPEKKQVTGVTGPGLQGIRR